VLYEEKQELQDIGSRMLRKIFGYGRLAERRMFF
jgi:hypothetical protein